MNAPLKRLRQILVSILLSLTALGCSDDDTEDKQQVLTPRNRIIVAESCHITEESTSGTETSSPSSIVITAYNVSPDIYWFTDTDTYDIGIESLSSLIESWSDTFSREAPNAIVRFYSGHDRVESIAIKVNALSEHDSLDGTLEVRASMHSGNPLPNWQTEGVTNVAIIILDGDSDETEDVTSMLYGETMTLEKHEGAEGRYTLTLESLDEEVLQVVDKPQSHAWLRQLDNVIEPWSFGLSEQFPSVFVMHASSDTGDISNVFILELSNPNYDQENEQLTFAATLLNEGEAHFKDSSDTTQMKSATLLQPSHTRGTISGFRALVMAPLYIDIADRYEWQTFESYLNDIRNIGVTAVSVFVWWGLVEKTQNEYDWSYYDILFKKITDTGLKLQPIIAFHGCGGYVGDTVTIPLPSWIFDVAGSGSKFVNELQDPGYPNVVSFWAENNDAVHKEYREFMTEFQTHFAEYSASILEIGIGCGPDGQLRYPSFDIYEDNGRSYGRGYPSRGYLYCYSKLAELEFAAAMQEKYNTITALNQAWGTRLDDFGPGLAPTNGDAFFDIQNSSAYINGQYGKDFIDWYHSELVTHGKEMITLAIGAFDGTFADVPLSIRLPGVEWTMGDPIMPRSAEVCAGQLLSDFDINVQSDGCGRGYASTMQMIASLKSSYGREIEVNIAGLELANDNIPPAYSMPSSLVFGVADEAHANSVTIRGENAIAPNSGSTFSEGGFWWNINQAISNCWYDGITIFSIVDVCADAQQRPNFQELIRLHE